MHAKQPNARRAWLLTALLGLAPLAAAAFDSGSTGADGAFNPLVDTQVVLPPDGVLNYTDVNIPAGVTVTFKRNATNTPVTILASGNVTIAGSIVLNGGNAADSGAAGDGNLGDDGLPGRGGPGGFDGGRGGTVASPRGGNGSGPGGGSTSSGRGGGGGGFATRGGSARYTSGLGGLVYGAATLLPLIGGSGGAGGTAGSNFSGTGGGGGGGAILIAATGTVDISGILVSDGGPGGHSTGSGAGAEGGGGSGGAIRIVATSLQGNGTIAARGGVAFGNGGNGSAGRIRLEAENFLRTARTTPDFTFAAPADVFVAGLPALSITSVAGVAAPAQPTGNADITLATGTPNPVTVAFHASGVPVGNTVTLTVLPANAAPLTAVSDALAGTDASSTASASVNLPDGPSVLQASVSFTVTAAIGDALKNYAKGERVERIELAAASGAASRATLITVSGKRYVWSGGRAIN